MRSKLITLALTTSTSMALWLPALAEAGSGRP